MDCKLYTQQESRICGRGIWHYLIDTPIGQYHVIQWEKPGKELEEVIIPYDNEKAEKKFGQICRKILKESEGR